MVRAKSRSKTSRSSKTPGKSLRPSAAAEDAAPDADEHEENEHGEESNGHSENGNGHASKRRTTVQAMAAKQRDISVSEFFAKNRHLLGFDNPRKALLTTIKEAVDNSLDACEEAGILPEIWVRVEQTAENRFRVSVQDNGPGIVKKQIPLIFGKLLYGSKFHRLRMSRGQQGIGISAAGMYGVLTTGQPVRILSKISRKSPTHHYDIQIDTKQNRPEILNGRGEGVDIPAGESGQQQIEKLGIHWQEVSHGTLVTIELEAKYQRGRGSVDDYLEQTAIANPHVTLHYVDPDRARDEEAVPLTFERSTPELPPEPKEIKPHPYGVELGMLVTMLKDTKAPTISQFLSGSFSRVSGQVAKRICDKAGISTRASIRKVGRSEVDKLYKALQETKIQAPSTDCIAPIGEPRLLKGLHQVVPGEFYAAATRPPSVYRGNPFLVEVALAYGGNVSTQKVTLEGLTEMLGQSDSRSLRQFLMSTFNGVGAEGAGKIIAEAELGMRVTPSRLKPKEIAKLHESLQNVSVDEGQAMTVLRYANRVPLQFQPGACVVTQTVMGTNWRSYGLTQSRNALPSGPVTLMVHVASVWVPFTSESKEAIASYPEIQKEIRLGLQSVGRQLGMYLRRRQRSAQEGERRNVFLRYIGEVAEAVSSIKRLDAKKLYDQLLKVAKRKTAEADAKYDERGKKVVKSEEELFGDNVLIVPQAPPATAAVEDTETTAAERSTRGGRSAKKRRGT